MCQVSRHFNPRPPWGGRPSCKQVGFKTHDFNPRPPWGGRLNDMSTKSRHRNFNPRPSWGGRPLPTTGQSPCRHFNPRPPWGGRRFNFMAPEVKKKFQSTPSVGRATRRVNRRHSRVVISIHALRGEGDDYFRSQKATPTKFQSTPSVGRATIYISVVFIIL